MQPHERPGCCQARYRRLLSAGSVGVREAAGLTHRTHSSLGNSIGVRGCHCCSPLARGEANPGRGAGGGNLTAPGTRARARAVVV